MRTFRLAAPTAVCVLAAISLAAQDPGYGGMGGMGRVGSWRERGASTARALPTAEQLEGPPLPDFFVPRFDLDSGQAGEYRVVYDSFMSTTATIRDSAQAARRAIDDAFRGGDRAAARASFPTLQALGDSLAKEDARFDRRLKSFLAGSQLKAYKKWKDEQQRQAEDDRRQEMEQQGGRRRGSQ
jgi:hypothetical protein